MLEICSDCVSALPLDECVCLLLRQPSHLSLLQTAQFQPPNGHANQPQHTDVQRCQQTADLAVPSFVQHNLQPGVLPAAAQHSRSLCREKLAVVLHSFNH